MMRAQKDWNWSDLIDRRSSVATIHLGIQRSRNYHIGLGSGAFVNKRITIFSHRDHFVPQVTDHVRERSECSGVIISNRNS
jgi:hypothetical protein